MNKEKKTTGFRPIASDTALKMGWQTAEQSTKDVPAQ